METIQVKRPSIAQPALVEFAELMKKSLNITLGLIIGTTLGIIITFVTQSVGLALFLILPIFITVVILIVFRFKMLKSLKIVANHTNHPNLKNAHTAYLISIILLFIGIFTQDGRIFDTIVTLGEEICIFLALKSISQFCLELKQQYGEIKGYQLFSEGMKLFQVTFVISIIFHLIPTTSFNILFAIFMLLIGMVIGIVSIAGQYKIANGMMVMFSRYSLDSGSRISENEYSRTSGFQYGQSSTSNYGGVTYKSAYSEKTPLSYPTNTKFNRNPTQPHKYCSQCGFQDNLNKNWNFCPNCGANQN